MDDGRARSRVRVPGGMADRAREHAAAGLPPAVPRDAATVILVRPGAGGGGVEVFLLRRTEALEFAPGAYVFPGGSVDERDAGPAIADAGWVGPAPAEIGRLLGISAGRARALVCAAVRETFEESGVLLAGPAPAELVADSVVPVEDRQHLLNGSLSLGGLLSRHGLALRADLLTPWARWITPEISPRRFDTWFFAALPPGQLAVLPAGQAGGSSPTRSERPGASPPPRSGRPGASSPPRSGRPGGSSPPREVWGDGSPHEQGGSGGDRSPRGDRESDSGTWWRPIAALEAARAGEITLLPPTAVTLAELAGYQDIAGVLAERRVITPLIPTVVVEDGRTWLVMPQAVEYPL
ncbi:MAG TPA: NUDIX hydrolase [Streptosporangiaceae bacterium]|nr:NUDIX hydrolase [Streptosporangiaceae bacterium]